jgi:hypothetical protein
MQKLPKYIWAGLLQMHLFDNNFIPLSHARQVALFTHFAHPGKYAAHDKQTTV